MKVECSQNKIIVYLFDEKYDNKDIKNILVNLFNNLNKYYNIELNDSYNLELYINKYYGMIVELQENKNKLNEDDIVNIKLNILKDTLFLYEVDEPLNYLDNEIYYYEDKFYINIKDKKFTIFENSNIVYGNEVYKIIGRGIKI